VEMKDTRCRERDPAYYPDLGPIGELPQTPDRLLLEL
jgi:hypothetical protein